MAIITACGSGKNKEIIHSVCKKLDEKGHIVLTPPLHNIGKYTDNMDLEGEVLLWKGATFAHLKRLLSKSIPAAFMPERMYDIRRLA